MFAHLCCMISAVGSTKHFYSKTNQMHQCLKFIYFGMSLYMFWTVVPSIISSSILYIQHQAYVIQVMLTAC